MKEEGAGRGVGALTGSGVAAPVLLQAAASLWAASAASLQGLIGMMGCVQQPV